MRPNLIERQAADWEALGATMEIEQSRRISWPRGSESRTESPNISASPPDSPHAFARYYGLCRDYTDGCAMNDDLVPFPPDDADQQMLDPQSTPTLEVLANATGVSGPDQPERLDVDRSTAGYLSALVSLTQVESVSDCIDDGCSRRKMDLELPILSGDHDLQMCKLQRRNELKLTAAGVDPLIFQQSGESFDWSQADIERKSQLDRGLESEKLDVHRDALEYFQGVCKLSKGGEWDLLDETAPIPEVSCKTADWYG